MTRAFKGKYPLKASKGGTKKPKGQVKRGFSKSIRPRVTLDELRLICQALECVETQPDLAVIEPREREKVKQLRRQLSRILPGEST